MRRIVLLMMVAALLLTSCTSKRRMEKEIAIREDTISQLEAQAEAKDQEIAAKEAEIESKKAEIAKNEEELARLQSEIEALGKRQEQQVDQLNSDLQRVLGDLQQKEKLWLQEKEGMSTITMPNALTFASGSANLTDEGKAIIDTIWTVLSKYPDRDVFIEGHTDSIPIGPGLQDRFASNWELSALRAVAVLRYVLTNYEAEAGRLAAVGYGEYRPVATNSTEEGRARNRRVVISVRPRK